MQYIKSSKYDKNLVKNMIMGPNTIKLEEELLENALLKENDLVLDLGSGKGLSSVFMAKEYLYKVVAADLWSDPEENKVFFESMGLTDNEIMPVKADANELSFEKESFDGVVSVDSYNYFGRNKTYLTEKLLPFVKKGGYIYIAIPGMKKDIHDNIPPELLLSWDKEQLDYLHDVNYWKNIICSSEGVRIIELKQMLTNEEAWRDWLCCDNEYAVNDRKSYNAGAGKYLNFIKIVLQKL